MSTYKPKDIRTNVTLRDPQNITAIIDHVANGGSVLDLCKMWAVRYSDVMKFIRSNIDYNKQYEQALKDREEWAKERVMAEIRSLSTYSIKDAINPDGTFKRLAELPEELAASIKEVDSDGSVKFSDKLKALDMYGKQLGIFTDKKEITGKVTLEQLILAADKMNDAESSS